jgi:hypothetical protein
VLYRPLAWCAPFVAVAMFGTGIAGATTASTAGAAVKSHVIVVRQEPFFPLMLIDQCTSSAVARAHRLGINLIINETCAGLSPRQQLSMI